MNKFDENVNLKIFPFEITFSFIVNVSKICYKLECASMLAQISLPNLGKMKLGKLVQVVDV